MMTEDQIRLHYIVDPQLVIRNANFFRLLEWEKWIEHEFNKMWLVSDIEMAKATQTPLYGDQPHWIWDGQSELFNQFMESRSFRGMSVSKLADNPTIDQGAYAEARAAALEYADYVRDVTAMSLQKGEIFLCSDDPRIGQ
jgi:hypothetical protein